MEKLRMTQVRPATTIHNKRQQSIHCIFLHLFTFFSQIEAPDPYIVAGPGSTV